MPEDGARGNIIATRRHIEAELSALDVKRKALLTKLAELQHNCPHSWGESYQQGYDWHDSSYECTVCKGNSRPRNRQ